MPLSTSGSGSGLEGVSEDMAESDGDISKVPKRLRDWEAPPRAWALASARDRGPTEYDRASDLQSPPFGYYRSRHLVCARRRLPAGRGVGLRPVRQRAMRHSGSGWYPYKQTCHSIIKVCRVETAASHRCRRSELVVLEVELRSCQRTRSHDRRDFPTGASPRRAQPSSAVNRDVGETAAYKKPATIQPAPVLIPPPSPTPLLGLSRSLALL